MEVMFYIIAGKFNPSNDDFPVKTLITKDKFADSMNNLVLCGKAPYVIAVETPEELNAEDKRELLIRVCKTINDELSRFEVHTGSSAFLEDVCTY